MAKHPVPKYKTTRTKSKTRHSAFMSNTRKKLMGMVTKLKNIDLKGNLDLKKKGKSALVKKVKA
jgi:hypothetical protein